MNKKQKFFERRQSNSGPSVDDSKLTFGPEGESSDSSNITAEHWQVSMDEADNYFQQNTSRKESKT